jgi:hypothetical protein
VLKLAYRVEVMSLQFCLCNAIENLVALVFIAANGSRKRGEQRKTWINNIKEWTYLNVFTLLRAVERREEGARLAFVSSLARCKS